MYFELISHGTLASDLVFCNPSHTEYGNEIEGGMKQPFCGTSKLTGNLTDFVLGKYSLFALTI